MNRFDVVYILFVRISGAAHKADYISGIYHIPYCKAFGKWVILLQVGIIIVAFGVKGTNADSPATVTVPAHRFHNSAFYRHNGRSQATHQVIAQMLAGKAKAAAYAKVGAVAITITGGNGRICL